MLRLAALVLLLVNLGLLAVQAGGTDHWLTPSVAQREPERLARQVNPGQIRLVPAAQAAAQAAALAAAQGAAAQAASASAMAAAPVPPVSSGPGSDRVCLESAPLDSASAAAAERWLAAAGLPAGSWVARRQPAGDAYLVYMGRFADAGALARKREELLALQVAATELRNQPALQPGLSLGQFDSAAAAQAALLRFGQRGIRTAKVLALPGQGPAPTRLQLPAADGAVRDRLAAWAEAGGERFQACVARPAPASAAAG